MLHFVDNTVALSKAVHGYANEPDMAAVVNAASQAVAVLSAVIARHAVLSAVTEVAAVSLHVEGLLKADGMLYSR